jgi:hypothetical protein
MMFQLTVAGGMDQSQQGQKETRLVHPTTKVPLLPTLVAGGQPVSTPVFGSRLIPGGNAPAHQKRKTSGGKPGTGGGQIEALWVNVIGVIGAHTGQLTFKGSGATVILACTGRVFSAMPPPANVDKTIMARHNLNKTATRRPFPKFDVLISLPPYLLQQKDSFSPYPAK